MPTSKTLLFVSILTFAAPLQAKSLIVNIDDTAAVDLELTKYYIQSLIPWNVAALSVNQQELALDCDRAGDAICENLEPCQNFRGELVLDCVEDYWENAFLAKRVERDDSDEIPADLSAFSERHAYRAWPFNIIEISTVKRAKRVIYRSMTVSGRRISVSETYVADGSIRETEIAIQSRTQPQNYQFYVYDADGHLSRESEFPSGLKPAPKICVACHLNQFTGSINRFLPGPFLP